MYLDLQGLLPDLNLEGLCFKACLAGLACPFCASYLFGSVCMKGSLLGLLIWLDMTPDRNRFSSVAVWLLFSFHGNSMTNKT